MIRRLIYLFLLLQGCIFLYSEEGTSIFLNLMRNPSQIYNLPGNVDIITNDKIRSKNANNIGEILEDITSTYISKTGTIGSISNIGIRGLSSQQVSILIDGIKMNDPALGTVDLNSIPLEHIERIEIIKGAVSSLYGTNAVGGAINIITKQPKETLPNINISASYSTFNTQHYVLDFNTKKEQIGGNVIFAKHISNGWRENSDFDNYNILSKLTYENELYGVFKLSGSFFKTLSGVPGLGISLDLYDGTLEKKASSPNATQETNRNIYILEHQKNWDRFAIKTTLYSKNNLEFYYDPDSIFGSIDDKYESFVYGFNTRFSFNNGLTIGTDWNEEIFTQTDRVQSINIIDKTRLNTACYIQQELNINNLSIVPSLRFDDNSSFGGVLCPHITFIWDIKNDLSFFLNSGKAWRAPTFNDLYYPLSGNPNLKAEEGISSDIGIKYLRQLFNTKISYFYIEMKNLIQWAPSNKDIWIPQNIGKTKHQGVEFTLENKIIDGLYNKLNYTYLWAEDLETNTNLPYRPCNKLNYAIYLNIPYDIRLDANIEYTSSQKTGDIYPPIVEQLPEYTLFGLKIAKSMPNYELWFKIDNLTDKKYQTRLEYPLPGRTFLAGINIRFNS